MASTSPKLTNYHCLCSQFILLSTQALEAYRQRSGNALDKAYILPLAQPSSSTKADMSSLNSELSEAHLDNDSSSGKEKGTVSSSSAQHYGVLHPPSISSTSLACKDLVIVMRSDGFEPRYQVKCARCDLTIGYHLDASLFSNQAGAQSGERPREDVLYVVPGSLKTLD
jgi:hypothetical protein